MTSEPIPPQKELLHFPVKTVFFLLTGVIFSGIVVGMISNLLAFQFYDVSQADFFSKIADEQANLADRTFLRIITLLNHALTFLVPSIVLCWLLHRNNWARFLKIDSGPNPIILLLTVFFIFAAMPLVQLSIWVNQLLELPQWAVDMESQTEGVIRSFLTMNSGSELALSFFVMAILPALGEEFLFRGIIQQTLSRVIKNEHAVVWVAALIFSFFHFQFEGFFARMLLGGALGYLLVWTKNLWVPVFAHLLFNGMQVIATYFYKEKLNELNLESAEMPELGLIIFSIIFVPTIGWLIWRISSKKESKTELIP